MVGQPIDVASGNMFEQATDYTTTGQNPLAFTRYYNSQGNTAPVATFAAALGVNWRSTYDRDLNIASATSVTAERADGQQLRFTLNGGVWTSDTDVDVTLINSGATWTLTDHNDTTETYTAVTATEAQLQTIKARNGFTQTLGYNGNGQLISVTDSYGRTLRFSYGGSGFVQTVTTPDDTTVTYGYTAIGGGSVLTSATYSTTPATTITYLYQNASLPFALTGITDENGNRYATWTYDSTGRALTSQLGAGADLTTIAYNSDGSRTVTNALGVQDLYKFTTLQGVPKVTEIDRAATATTATATKTFTYDSNGYAASQTDWNGNATTYVNDIHGQPTTINEAVGTPAARTTTIAYDATFVHLPKQIVTPGLTASFTYDATGELLTRTLADTTTATAPYSTKGQSRTATNTWSNSLLASTKSPNGNTTSFAYDGSGALVKITNALGQATSITAHSGGGLPQTIVDPNGVTISLTYDARQRPLTSTVTTSQGPRTTAYTYDAAGNRTKTTLPDGSYLTNTYDAAHRLTGAADLFMNSVAYTLDAAGDQTNTVVSNPGGTVARQHSATFDAFSRLLHDVGGVGQTTVYSYDANGNAITITDPLLRATQQNFDALNRATKITDPAQGNTAITYDAHDRPLSVTDPNGKTTTYTYDGFGDVIQDVSPARGATFYRYDLDGNLTQRVDARGAIANYAYDALDRVTATAYPADTTENIIYTYDQVASGFGIGRLTTVSDGVGTLSRAYDERGNVLSESRVRGTGATALALLTKYTYDAASRIASITYPLGTTVAYARDGMGRITGVTAQPLGAAQPTPVLSGITYRPFGPANALTYGNGVAESRSFDLDYRLTALSGTGNQPIQSLSYGYNAANDVLSIADGVTSANSQHFGYDSLDRLTSANGGYGTLAYTYDANGNRLTENPAAPVTLDGLGSITGLAYNLAGRLASTSAGTQQLTQYTYDAFGQRLTKTGSVTALSFFQYDQGGRLLEETDNQGSIKADYIYFGNRPVAEYNAGQLYFLHDDRLGTPQVATETTQATVWVGNYEPFGALSPSSQTALLGLDLRLPGQENDMETGLYHNGFRDYLPNLGRYLESDPIGLGGGMNPFLYANGNPEIYIDTAGLDTYIVNRQLARIGSSDTSQWNPISHTFVVTTNQDGSVDHTYSWGNDANLSGWNMDQKLDIMTAQEALKDGSAERVGNATLDPFVAQEFAYLNQPQFEHLNLIVLENCKTETTKLINGARARQEFFRLAERFKLMVILRTRAQAN
jgi:RHS repeat-associated protein